MKRFVRMPSPSMAVALVALVVAVCGTAIAAAQMSGDKLIKRHSLSGNRLRGHTLGGAQINLRRLGKVPRAAKADSATKALTATTAQNARNAASVGGRTIRWLEMNADGTILAQSGGFALTNHDFAGIYMLGVGSAVAGHAVLVSNGWGAARSGAAIAGPCGTGTAEVNCDAIEGDANDGKHIEVVTSDTTNTPSDRPFYLMVY
jgi:hypothetical protein